MRFCWQGFCGSNHSWSIVAQNICRGLIKSGHDIDLFSTNGIDHFPKDLKNNLIGYYEENKVIGKLPQNNYDGCLSYTAMKNFPIYLNHSKNNRLGIWSYEFDSLPTGFAKNHKSCDWILAPSVFSKQIFINNKIPEEKIKVIPHGINFNEIETAIPFKLKTNKSTKILVLLTQLHIRKNIVGTLDAFGKAFNKNDDVCLILKIKNKKPAMGFEIDFNKIFNQFKQKYPNHAEIEIIDEFIENIYSLYKSCDINYSLSHSECFGMPALEGFGCNLINIMPKFGGFLDFLNNENSLLVDGDLINAPPQALYYENKSGTKYFNPNISNAIDKLKFAVQNKEKLKNEFNKNFDFKKYDWQNITNEILNLCSQ